MPHPKESITIPVSALALISSVNCPQAGETATVDLSRYFGENNTQCKNCGLNPVCTQLGSNGSTD